MTSTRRTPVVIAACLAAGVLAALLGTLGEDPVVAFPVTSLAGLLAGSARSRGAGAAAFVLLIAGVGVGDLVAVEDTTIVPEVMLPGALYFTGLALAERERVAERLAVQTAELEAERGTYARLSVRYERARIAAELHDVVAHAISVMVVQAGAGQRLAVSEPAALDGTFAVIGEAARQAEADLGRLAALLTQDGTGDEGDLGLVHEIIRQAETSGLPVSLRLEGEAAAVRGVLAHTVCRVVQEALTNALRYAPGAPVAVRVDARPVRLDVEIVNAAAPVRTGLGLGSGRGLTGLRERVAALGGVLEAGPGADGGWIVKARMPRRLNRDVGPV